MVGIIIPNIKDIVRVVPHLKRIKFSRNPTKSLRNEEIYAVFDKLF